MQKQFIIIFFVTLHMPMALGPYQYIYVDNAKINDEKYYEVNKSTVLVTVLN